MTCVGGRDDADAGEKIEELALASVILVALSAGIGMTADVDGFIVVVEKVVRGPAVDVGETIEVVREAFVVGIAGTDDNLVPFPVLDWLLLELWLRRADDGDGSVVVVLALVGFEVTPPAVSGVDNVTIEPLSACVVVVKLVGVVEGPVELLDTVTAALEDLDVAKLDGLDTGGCEAGDDPDEDETVKGGTDVEGDIIAEDEAVDVPVTEDGTTEDEAMEGTDALAKGEPVAEVAAVPDGKTVPDVKVVAGSTTLVEGALVDEGEAGELIAGAADELVVEGEDGITI